MLITTMLYVMTTMLFLSEIYRLDFGKSYTGCQWQSQSDR